MIYKKIIFTTIICATIFLFCACSREVSPTPELAIKEYLSLLNKNPEFQVIKTNAFGGKIMVFYKYSDQYYFQWVKPLKKGFIVADKPYLLDLKENDFIEFSTIYGEDLGKEFTAFGLIVNDSRVSYIKAKFSIEDSMDANISKGFGLVEIFDGHVIVKSIIAYDKNHKVVYASNFN